MKLKLRSTSWLAAAGTMLILPLATASGAPPGESSAKPAAKTQKQDKSDATGANKEGAQKEALDPKAMAIFRDMSDFLSKQQKFTLHADGSLEVVRNDGQKLEFAHASDISVRRPNGLKSERRGDIASLQLFYDGKELTLFDKKDNYYATRPAPATIDATIDMARDKLGLETAAADLLYSNPYQAMTEDVVKSTYIGTSDVRGVRCHQLAFRGNESDWQLWVADAKEPVPCKLVITSKKVKGTPEFRTEFSQWNFAPDFTDATFHFTPPPGAQKIDFLQDVKGKAVSKGQDQSGKEPPAAKGKTTPPEKGGGK